MGKTDIKKNNIDQIIKRSGISTAEICWNTGLNIEELDLCVAGLIVLTKEQVAKVKAYLGV